MEKLAIGLSLVSLLYIIFFIGIQYWQEIQSVVISRRWIMTMKRVQTEPDKSLETQLSDRPKRAA
jgi:hypothetical protein